jgi:hypothetical protein
MKRIPLGIALLLMFLFVSTSAFGYDWAIEFGGKGDKLITLCKPAVLELDEPSREFARHDDYNIGWCRGFVSGIADSIQDDANLTDTSRDQLVRVVQKYLEDHPEGAGPPLRFL